MTNKAIEFEIGQRLQKERLKRNLTQNELSARSGLSRVSISLVETGKGASLSSFVQILRALDKLENIEALLPTTDFSPIEILNMQLKGSRQRARHSKVKSNLKK